ncbi:MAG: glycosyltransferase family 2 protein [Flavobacteriales bacterium]|nr:glycosyltransferase family 2 protein [Flavobacteriales bacterium]
MKLSAVIITYNEEKNIGRCLESLRGVADHVVVIDSFSTDRTETICRQYGAEFHTHAFEGHIQQKNYALGFAKGTWTLSLDADEALDETLKKNIRDVIENRSGSSGYRMNRLTNYCGHWVKHCGWYPDTKLRLVKTGSAKWTGVNPHDKLTMAHESDEVQQLNGDILHYSYYTREDHLKQIEYFSGIAARELFTRGERVATPMIVLKVVAQFIKSYFLKSGFLDGATGFTISRLSAFATWRKYTLLRKLHHARS